MSVVRRLAGFEVPGAGWRVPAALVLWVLVLYAGALDNGFHYDDSHSLVDNRAVRSLDQVARYFVDPGLFSAVPDARMYRPLVLVSYAVNHALGGYEPFGYHLLNVLLHAVNAVLVWRLALQLLGRPAAALAAALLFATHPLASEPVNYISSRSTSLAALFILAGAIVAVAAARRLRARHHAVLAALAGLALMTKAVGVVLVPIAALHLVLQRAPARAWSLLAGPTAAALAYVIGTRAIVGKALVDEPVRSAASQAGTQLKALAFYLHAAAMPVRLSVEPQFAAAEGLFSAASLAALLLAVSLLALAATTLRRRPVVAFGAGWIVVTLAPTSVVPLNVLVNEHRLYLPLAGVALLAGALITVLPRRRWRPAAAALLVLWAGLVAQRNTTWDSELSLWTDAVRKGPAMARAHANLGKAYLEAQRYDEAIAASRRSLELEPGSSRAHYNIATAYLEQGRYEEAVAGYQRALEIEPRFMEALNNLGTAYQNMGRPTRAIAHYRRALEQVEDASIYHNMGSAFLAADRADSAIAYFERALRRAPDSREALEGLARALRRDDRLTTAAQVLIRALRSRPEDEELLRLLAATHADLGRHAEALVTYRRAGLEEAEARLRAGQGARGRKNWDQAREHFAAGLTAAPDDPRLLDALGTVQLAQGEPQAALASFRRAAQQDSTLASAYRHIGLVNVRYGRPVEALAALERARDLEQGSQGKTWELIGRAAAALERLPQAAAAYRRAVELQPERADLLHNLASLHQQMGDLDEAERLYRRALELEPAEPQALYNLGYLLLERGRYAEGARLLERLLAAHPEQATAYVNLASAYLNLDQGARAAAAYERFLELYPEQDATRRRVEEQLQALRAAGD